jgi:hypothetical protein
MPMEGCELTGLMGTVNSLLHPALLHFGCLYSVSMISLWATLFDLTWMPPACWSCLDVNASLLLSSPGHPHSSWPCSICLGCHSRLHTGIHYVFSHSRLLGLMYWLAQEVCWCRTQIHRPWSGTVICSR